MIPISSKPTYAWQSFVCYNHRRSVKIRDQVDPKNELTLHFLCSNCQDCSSASSQRSHDEEKMTANHFL
jgi:hypothetical protein